MWKLIPTAKGFWKPGCEKDTLTQGQSGMTSEPSMETLGVATWISSLAASPARTSAQPEKAPESLKETEAAFGSSWRVPLAKYDPATSSWKTFQLSLFGGLTSYAGTWPKWGTIVNGALWEHGTLVRLTGGIGGGAWPTPQTMDSIGMSRPVTMKGNSPRIVSNQGVDGMAGLRDLAANWPTPTEDDSSNVNPKPNRIFGLAAASRDFPHSLQAQESESDGQPSLSDGPDSHHRTRRLNPFFVEWLMGLPLLHTEVNSEPIDSPETSGEGVSSVRALSDVWGDGEVESPSSRSEESTRNRDSVRYMPRQERPIAGEEAYQSSPHLPRLRRPIPIQALQAADLCIDGVPESSWPTECREALERARQDKGLPGMWETVLAEAEKRHGLREAGMYLRSDIQSLLRASQTSKNRVKRLKALGNGIVPAVVAEFLRRIAPDLRAREG